MDDSKMIGEYKIIAKIGEGSFGQIYQVTKDDKTYAIKTEHIANIKPMVSLEYQILKQLQTEVANNCTAFGFPRVYDYKEEDHFSYMVMERLDITLQDFINLQMQNEVSKEGLLVIMYNTFRCIRTLHEKGYLYRDVKPSNFMLKKSQLDENKGKIYLIDLGLCKKFTKKDSNQHIPMRANKKMIGTPIFCSLNVHHGIETSRRDDLQSWIYMVIYLVKKLPWEQNLVHSLPNAGSEAQSELKQSNTDKIGNLKELTNIQQLIKDEPKLPKSLLKMYQYVRHLQFETKPEYQLIQMWNSQQFTKISGSKGHIKEEFITVQKIQELQKKKEKSPIKISFKAPILQNKLKKKKIQQINILNLLQN